MVLIKQVTRFKMDDLRRMQKIAELDGISLSESIREAVRDYLLKRG